MASEVKVTVARSAGFCFGVARAANAVESEIKSAPKSQRIFTLGKLIHNEQYNSYLRENGACEIDADKIEQIYKDSLLGKDAVIVIRTHGIEKSIQKGRAPIGVRPLVFIPVLYAADFRTLHEQDSQQLHLEFLYSKST